MPHANADVCRKLSEHCEQSFGFYKAWRISWKSWNRGTGHALPMWSYGAYYGFLVLYRELVLLLFIHRIIHPWIDSLRSSNVNSNSDCWRHIQPELNPFSPPSYLPITSISQTSTPNPFDLWKLLQRVYRKFLSSLSVTSLPVASAAFSKTSVSTIARRRFSYAHKNQYTAMVGMNAIQPTRANVRPPRYLGAFPLSQSNGAHIALKAWPRKNRAFTMAFFVFPRVLDAFKLRMIDNIFETTEA